MGVPSVEAVTLSVSVHLEAAANTSQKQFSSIGNKQLGSYRRASRILWLRWQHINAQVSQLWDTHSDGDPALSKEHQPSDKLDAFPAAN